MVPACAAHYGRYFWEPTSNLGGHTLPAPVMFAQMETEDEDEDGATGSVDPLQAFATNKRLARRAREPGQGDKWLDKNTLHYLQGGIISAADSAPGRTRRVLRRAA